MFIKLNSFSSILLITLIYNIFCDHNIYLNQFSIYFNRAYNKYNIEKELGKNSVDHFLFNNIYSSITIGQYPKLIYIFLTFNDTNINITSSKYLDAISFNKDLYKNDTIIQKDKIQFPKMDNLLDLNFNLNINENDLKEEKEQISYLGLKYTNIKNSFINQLKDNNMIINRVFSVLYKENSIRDDPQFEGQILFGLLPHDVTTRYKKEDLFWTPIIDKNKNEKDLKWEIKFDSIFYNNEKNSIDIKEAEFDLNFNLIIGPEEFRQKILNNYFEKFIKEKLCKEEIVYNKINKEFYIAYSCKHHYDIEDFPTLSFYSKDLNGSYTLDYNQLLCVFKERVFLRVIFKKNEDNKKWILGRAFMEIFPIVFDADNKRIGFYKIKISENHPLLLFFFFIFSISIFGIFFYRGLQIEKVEKLELAKNKKDDDYKKENKKNDKNNTSQKEIINENKNNDEKYKLLENDEKIK